MIRNMKRIFKLISLTLAMMFLLTLLPVTALAAPMDTRTLATINKPGVVLVYSEWTATMVLREFAFDDSMYDMLTQQVEYLIYQGQIAEGDQNAIYSAMVQLMIMQMADYAFYTGNSETMQVSTGAIGTGFVVTPDGYLVTNAHVVTEDENTLYRSFAITNLNQIAEATVLEILQEFRRQGYQMSQDEVDSMYNAMFNLLAQSFELGNLQTSYECFQGNVQPGSDVTVKGLGMDLRKIGEPYPGKDVAILKIDGRNNLPTVTLGDDSKMQTGDRVYAMGYPGAATLHEGVNILQSMQEPTLTSGIISARKQMTGGWGVFQMDAAIHYGNSGGPLFNEEGEVIGVNTFGSVDESSGTLVGGMNFAIPISIAKQFLNEINVTPEESSFTTNFKKALSAYNSGDFKTALDLLHSINDTNPGFPVVQDLLADVRVAYDANPQSDPANLPTETNNAAAALTVTGDKEKDSKGLSTLTIILIIAGVVLLAGAAVVIVLVTKKKKTAFTPPYNAQQGTQPWQGTPQQYGPMQQPMAQATSQPVQQPVFQPAAEQLACGQCQSPLNPGSKFCNKCGTPVPEKPAPLACTQCGAELKPDDAFCDTCGTKI